MDWDLSTYFESFESSQFDTFKSQIASDYDRLQKSLDRHILEETKDLESVATTLVELEELSTRISHLSSYISCLVAADASNEAYAAEEAALAETLAKRSKLHNQVLILIASLEDAELDALISSAKLTHCAYFLKRLQKESRNRMSPEEEALAADLAVHGIGAWSRLYFSTVSNMNFVLAHPEKGSERVPLSQLNSLLASAHLPVRKAALSGAATVVEESQHLFASALNAISGTRLELNRRRGISDFLTPGLFQSGIRRETLDALMRAIENKINFAREVFRMRTAQMGIDNPGWVDLRAALPIEGSTPDWANGVHMISKAFHQSYPAMGHFFDEMIEKRWVDYSPRNAKRPGGFCTTSQKSGESRIFMTYKDTLNDVLTLAHEAGHAWHSHILRNTRMMASRYPMTLAETASTFAERILTHGILADSTVDKKTRLVLLDAEVEHMLAFLLDLPIRFRFEEAVYHERSRGQLSARQLCELMAKTQVEFFGSTFSADSPDPWFWATKMHFYFDDIQFYNYPYIFGYLLSQAFMRQFEAEGPKVFENYERFLMLSGSRSCEAVVAETLGEDITKESFWSSCIDGLSANFNRYKELLATPLS